MTQNPFDALGGGGGFDMNALLEQAQQMQAQLVEAQEKLASTIFDGSVGGAVTAKVNGVGELTGVEINEGALGGTDAESLGDLGDLIVAAYRDAKAKADQAASEAMGPLSGGPGDDLGGLGGPGGNPGQLGF